MITTICMNGMPGVVSVFKNMEKLGISRHFDFNEIKNLQQFEDDLEHKIIFGAYHDSYMVLINLLKNTRNPPKIGFIWTSSPSETELQGVEIPMLNQLLHLVKIGYVDFMWVLKPDFCDITEILGISNVFYAPAPIPELPMKQNYDKKYISLFVPNTLKKNVFAQILSLMVLSKKHVRDAKIVTNVGFNHPSMTNVGWMSDVEYKRWIDDTYLAMHVSHAESFGYGAYEFLGRGIPTLISPTLARNFGLKDLHSYDPIQNLIVRDPDSVSEMVEKLRYLLSIDKKTYEDISYGLYAKMSDLRDSNNKKLKETLRDNVGL